MASQKQLEHLARIRPLAYASPRHGKRGPTWKVLAREEARRTYIANLMPHMDKIMQVHLDEAKKPLSTKERLYAFDQAIGQATKSIEIEDADLKLDV